MLALGLLLVVLAAALVAGAAFLTEGVAVEYAGQAVEPFTLFLLGAVTVAVLVLGLVMVRSGTRRTMKARREHKQLAKLRAERGQGTDTTPTGPGTAAAGGTSAGAPPPDAGTAPRPTEPPR
jgi:hypothetical protein